MNRGVFLIVKITNEGKVLEESLVEQFHLDRASDFNLQNFNDDYNDADLEIKDSLRFVGFVTDDNNDSLVVFPKKFAVSNAEDDANLLFEVINSFMQRRSTSYIGEKDDVSFVSNFPFAAFFNVYEYYKKYGLHIEDNNVVKPNHGKNINWKHTIKNAKKYLVEDSVVIFPFFYNEKIHQSTFLTECMIYVIDYTLDKFSYFLHLSKTGKKFPDIDYLKFKEVTISKLLKIKQKTFKDSTLVLIDSLIQFFSTLNVGGSLYLKFYNFSSVWEKMVLQYLNRYFAGVDDGLILDKSCEKNNSFYKPTYRPNLANQSHSIQPDYYYATKQYQFIFDAKYYNSITGINYKQIAYYLFLKEKRNEDFDAVPNITYSALILPGSERETKVHFKMDENYNKSCSDLVVYEEYIDIRDVMLDYISKTL